VNSWPGEAKTIYTIYSLLPEGFDGPLFEVPVSEETHYVDLWHHEELTPASANGKTWIRARADGFSRVWLGTREEGNVDCIARLPLALHVACFGDSLTVDASTGERIVVWAGMPAYGTKRAEFPVGRQTISLRETLGKHEERFVVQLFKGTELLDERVIEVPLATPRMISRVTPTPRDRTVPAGMSEIPSAEFRFAISETEVPNPVIPYPVYPKPWVVHMPRFFMDTTPVTNAEFKKFLDATGYRPKDPSNFLKHWSGGDIPKGMERHPVVWVSQEDARAYCRWAGKRLPTTVEWQYAAQGTDGRKYPWGAGFDSTRCNNSLNHTTPVDAYPSGASPFGVVDMVGNVWQMTNDVYDNGSYYFCLLRGGSFYHPTSSEWYVTGGPWPVDKHQVLLMVSPGFDRSSTVGFRCVRDAE
jgi:formylglycine-generating enzyme required for sulfatase activity